MRLFRRYTNNRGSALFMVISTMTAIMVSCMAMYFSVVSSRSTQYAVFNQQQSKSSAVSISEAVLAGIMEGNSMMTPLLTEIENLKVGETLTSSGTDFAAFDPSGTKEEIPNLGAYKIEITKLSENTIDLIVTTVVNGVSSVKHTVIDYSVEPGEISAAGPTQLFAATGYVPNDVFVEGGHYYADMYYDNEYTVIDAYDGIDSHVYGNLSAGGNLHNVGGLFPQGSQPLTYAILMNYIVDTNTVSKFPAGSKLYVGGDLVMNNGGGFQNVDIYVFGDMYVFANGLDVTNCNVFVDGNVYINKDLGLKSNIRANGEYIYVESGASINNLKLTYDISSEWFWTPEQGSFHIDTAVQRKTKTAEKWDSSSKTKGFMDPDGAYADLVGRTEGREYSKWTVKDTLPQKDIRFSRGHDPVAVYELNYSSTEKGCTINSITETGNDGVPFYDYAIVVDTGDDPENVYTIRVKGLFDLDGDNKKETFMWLPDNANPYSPGMRMNIIVKGRGSVVIDVPEGVIYQDLNQLKFMHYNWWVLLGGRYKIGEKGNSDGTRPKVAYYDSSGWKGVSAISLMESLIHRNCDSFCKCKYTEKASKNTCKIHTDQKLTEVHCSVHENIATYCEKCFPSLVGKDVDHTGDCKFRVGRQEIDAYLAANPSIEPLLEHDKDGKLIYPTTNIFLVSCAESADFRFSKFKEDGEYIMENMFFGYVYAPYMTFKSLGNGQGNGVRIVGGMTVSDYVLDDTYSMMACWPEKSPDEVMGEKNSDGTLHALAAKTWKIMPKRHG